MTVAVDVAWRVEPGLTDYLEAVAAMEERAAAIREGTAAELIWLVEHPPLYTGGTSAIAGDLRDPRLPVYRTGRGGRYTYHGPGQRVVYVMLDLNARGRDVRAFVAALENWIVAALGRLGVTAYTIYGRVGVWTGHLGDPAKVAAIGIRVRHWVTLHGAAINVAPNLADFAGIVPCGIDDARVTSVAALGQTASLAACDDALLAALPQFLADLPARPAAIALEARAEPS